MKISFDETNEKARRDFTSIVLDEEFKKFIFKLIKTAHDYHSIGHLSNLLTYEIYHEPLKQ
jgi:hypothetical protein